MTDYSPFRDLPPNLRELIGAVGFAEYLDLEEEELSIYDRSRHGLCMTCEGKLGMNSKLIISTQGIVAAYCSGVCCTDMAVLGFIQEKHDEITSAIDFRRGKHPQADNAPPSPDADPTR